MCLIFPRPTPRPRVTAPPSAPHPPALSPGSGFLPPQSHTESVCLPHLRASSNCRRGQPRSLAAQSPEHFLKSRSTKGAAVNSAHYRPPGRETHPPSRATPGLKEKMGPEVWKVSGLRSDSWVCPKPLINNSVSVLCFLHEKQRTSLLDSWFDLQHLNSLIWIHGRNISFPLGAQGKSESHRVPDLQKLAGREGDCRYTRPCDPCLSRDLGKRAALKETRWEVRF